MTIFRKMGMYFHTLLTATMITTGAVITPPSTAATLKVTVENVAPDKGINLGHFWLGFHDGSFDAFNAGEPASDGVALLAEEQVVGLGARILADFNIPVPQLTDIVINTFAAGTDYGFISPQLQSALEAGSDRPAISAILNSIFNSDLDVNDLPPSPGTIAAEFANSPIGKNGGVQDILFYPTLAPIPVVQPPGTTASTVFEVTDTQKNRFFSYATMLYPSDDAFIGNDDPKAIPIFDEQGKFLGADFVVLGNQSWDAGSLVNNEQIFPTRIKVAENGTIQPHPGLKVSGEGGVVDSQLDGLSFANANFLNPGYQVAHITIKQVDEPTTTQGLLVLGSLLSIVTVMSRLKQRKNNLSSHFDS